MADLNNNLFKYATKELSQDAVICWILNWVNYPQNELYSLGRELLDAINDEELNNWEEIKIYQQKKKADIVVVIPSQKKIIIIEDKVYSSEHDNQIETYKNEFEKLNTQKEELGIETDNPYRVLTVYLKTGFFYDADKLVKANYIINGNKFYDIVSKPRYKGKSEILDCYVEYLSDLLGWYDKNSYIPAKYEGGKVYCISREAYIQFLLMRYIFPEDLWDKDKKSVAYRVYNGSSSGRPWTELDIAEPYTYSDSEDKYELFWRIDTSTKGPYLSFRFYEVFDKCDESKKDRHKNHYDNLLNMTKGIVDSLEEAFGVSWNSVTNEYTGNYNESALITIELNA